MFGQARFQAQQHWQSGPGKNNCPFAGKIRDHIPAAMTPVPRNAEWGMVSIS